MPNNALPDFDEEFAKAVAEWRDKHRLREDDAVILLVELFRVHQQHWDELRRREIPSFEQFRSDIVKLQSSKASLMPDGLEALLTPQSLADLIAYLKVPK